MRRAPLVGSLTVVTLLVLAGCATSPPDAGGTVTAAPSPTEATPEASATPDSAETLMVTLEGLTVTGADEDTAAYSDPAALVALVERLVGAAPDVERDEDYGVTFYDWPGIRVLAPDGGPAAVAISSRDIAGIVVTTADGLTVGTTRDEALSAGAWESADADGDGAADFLGIDDREVDGTVSLTHPDRTGIQFVLLRTDDGVITQIQSPSNDFADV
jgi:hypothetical protein